MSERNKPSLRIDWFDGTLIEDQGASSAQNSSNFADEDSRDVEKSSKPKQFERKPIGFKKLLDISYLNPPALTLEVAHKMSFWLLLDTELKGDFIVLIVKILYKLYKSLEKGEKSIISNTLKSKLENTMLLETLKNYVIELPNVRVVEKRMNSQLWDDVESFYKNTLDICQGILDQEVYSQRVQNEIHNLIGIIEESVTGVKEEHSERFSDGLYDQIVELKSRCIYNMEENKELPIKITESKPKDPNHFKNLNIFPTRQDLLGESAVKIQPNLINGCYPSIEHYVDIQFKLLREDCFGPLREGICKYMKNPSKRRHENIRVHPKVRIIRTYVSNNKVGHLVDIAWHHRINSALVDSKKFSTNKQLMFGSLLLFTLDNFETILCATVLDSSLELLGDGYIAVTFQSPVSNSIFTEPYLMVESEVFFEPYHRVLKVLQESNLNDLPMERYIIRVQTETRPPAYLNEDTIYTITEPSKEEICFPVLDTQQWPLSSFKLDDSQMEAYKHALTKEFAVIQGPPGTGKTFIGVKIASTILANLSLEGTPMLIICYTNHALDQFLEGILNVTRNIVRLGSQSKNKNLEQFTLNNLRGKVKCKYSYLYTSKRKELEKIFKQMTEVQSEIEKCERELLCYSSVKSFLKIGSEKVELKRTKEDPILSWLFGQESVLDDDDDEEIDDWECQLDDLSTSDKVETCFSEKWALAEIDSLNHSIKYIKEVTNDELQREAMTEKIESQIYKVRKRLICFKRFIKEQTDLSINIPQDKEPYQLNEEQRWNVYFKAVGAIKDNLTMKINNLLGQHHACSMELEEVATLIDGEVMKTSRVVGVTTTTAARRHDLLKKLNSTIVIVEEAAEVLEAHVVASLTHHCQHLILIGDHKQLRPTAAQYKLAKDYNLEISLFERMIRNGIHARSLTIQRRMRPEFVELLVPTLYDRLDSHPEVLRYNNVEGMANNLYFLSHEVLEDSEGLEDSWSHKNSFEAKWCVSLADYLLHVGYTPKDITVLTTYTGQASLIKELSKNYRSLRDVKTTVVDNFQGEESRIVILSLVRSNREGKIGFLNANNRICVALSRAKEGFYMFGNMNILKSANKTWKVINDTLMRRNCVGKTLGIRSKKRDSCINIESSEKLDNFVKETCLKTREDK